MDYNRAYTIVNVAFAASSKNEGHFIFSHLQFSFISFVRLSVLNYTRLCDKTSVNANVYYNDNQCCI